MSNVRGTRTQEGGAAVAYYADLLESYSSLEREIIHTREMIYTRMIIYEKNDLRKNI